VTTALEAALATIDRGEPAILVEVVEVLGSAPREAGAAMLVTESGIAGTIGGGELEWRAIQRAREALLGEPVPDRLQLPLGPALQQCCGGHVTLALGRPGPADRNCLADRLDAWRASLPRLVLFGAGHVGQALARAIAPLPCRLRWIDSRAGLGPAEQVDDPATVKTEPDDLVLVMTHSHAMDLAIVEARLRRLDFAWLGLIGSATKRRRFEGQLVAAGITVERLDRLVCPIGLSAIRGKDPAVIAASVAAQMLVVIEALAQGQSLRSVA
jgi:xanthine dehydrogenase accessory factor